MRLGPVPPQQDGSHRQTHQCAHEAAEPASRGVSVSILQRIKEVLLGLGTLEELSVRSSRRRLVVMMERRLLIGYRQAGSITLDQLVSTPLVIGL